MLKTIVLKSLPGNSDTCVPSEMVWGFVLFLWMSSVALFLGMTCDLLLKSGHLKKHLPLLVFPDWLARPSVVKKILSFLLELAQSEGIRSLWIFSGHVSYLGLCVSFLKLPLCSWLFLNVLISQSVTPASLDVLLFSSAYNLLPPCICEFTVPHTTMPTTAFHNFCYLRSRLCHNFLSSSESGETEISLFRWATDRLECCE